MYPRFTSSLNPKSFNYDKIKVDTNLSALDKKKEELEIINNVDAYLDKNSVSLMRLYKNIKKLNLESEDLGFIQLSLKHHSIKANKVVQGIFDRAELSSTYSIYEKNSLGPKETKIISRIMKWVLYFEHIEEFDKLMKTYQISPFCTEHLGFNTIHHLCKYNLYRQLRSVLSKRFTYKKTCFSKSIVVALESVLSKKSEDTLDTPLHLCCIYNSYECFNELLSKQVSIHESNARGWLYSQLLPINNSKFWRRQQLQDMINYFKEKKSSIHDYVNHSDIDYDYCLICLRDCDPEEKSIIHLQLENIRSYVNNQYGKCRLKSNSQLFRFRRIVGKDKIVKLKGLKRFSPWKLIWPDEKSKFNYEIFLIQISEQLIWSIATEEGWKCFDLKRSFFSDFTFDKVLDGDVFYERFKDFQKHDIILDLLNHEFNVEKLNEIGIIIEHFPCHKFRERLKITQYLSEYWGNSISIAFLSFFKFEKKAFIPIIQIGYYYGFQSGYLFAFLIIYIGWTILFGIAELALQIAGYIFFDDLNNPLIFWNWFLISVWTIILIISWRRTENILAFLYGTEDANFDKIKRRRPMFTGGFKVSTITQKVDLKDSSVSWIKRFFVATLPNQRHIYLYQ